MTRPSSAHTLAHVTSQSWPVRMARGVTNSAGKTQTHKGLLPDMFEKQDGPNPSHFLYLCLPTFGNKWKVLSLFTPMEKDKLIHRSYLILTPHNHWIGQWLAYFQQATSLPKILKIGIFQTNEAEEKWVYLRLALLSANCYLLASPLQRCCQVEKTPCRNMTGSVFHFHTTDTNCNASYFLIWTSLLLPSPASQRYFHFLDTRGRSMQTICTHPLHRALVNASLVEKMRK